MVFGLYGTFSSNQHTHSLSIFCRFFTASKLALAISPSCKTSVSGSNNLSHSQLQDFLRSINCVRRLTLATSSFRKSGEDRAKIFLSLGGIISFTAYTSFQIIIGKTAETLMDPSWCSLHFLPGFWAVGIEINLTDFFQHLRFAGGVPRARQNLSILSEDEYGGLNPSTLYPIKFKSIAKN